MSLAVSKERIQQRSAVIAKLRDIQKRAKDAKAEQLAEIRSQYDAAWEEAESLKTEAANEYRDHQIKQLEDEWRAEGDPMPPEIRSGKATKGLATDQKIEERMQAFNKALRHGISELEREERALIEPSPEIRSVIASVDTKGGYLVVPKFGSQVLEKIYKDTMFRSDLGAEIETITDAGSIGYPTVEAQPDDYDWTTELKKVTDDASFTIGKRELIPHPMRKRIFISEFTLKNSAYQPAALVERHLARKLRETQEKAYFNGNGNSQPLGVMFPSAQGISTARDVVMDGLNAAAGLTYSGLNKVKFSVQPQYRRGKNCKWVFPTGSMLDLVLIVDGLGRPIWREGLVPGEPDILLKHPVYENLFMPANNHVPSSYVGIFGDFSFYKIVDVNVIPIRRIDDVHYENSLVAFVGNYWGDGMPTFEEAYARIQLPNQ
jgi:HK97 family phage major capsid protein